MRRIGSNIRKQNSKDKQHRITKNIIVYTHTEEPQNDFPRKIISPPTSSPCCNDQNRISVGTPKEVDGFKFQYRICEECGHAVKYYFPAIESTSAAVKSYRSMKRYMVQ